MIIFHLNKSRKIRTARGLDADALEELRVAERELDHLLDLGQLLAAPANVIVPDLHTQDFDTQLLGQHMADVRYGSQGEFASKASRAFLSHQLPRNSTRTLSIYKHGRASQ
jgi:hypothetical protein